MRSFKLVTEAKHCIRQSVLQAGPNLLMASNTFVLNLLVFLKLYLQFLY